MSETKVRIIVVDDDARLVELPVRQQLDPLHQLGVLLRQADRLLHGEPGLARQGERRARR